MTVVALCSVKGAPGTTTASLALTAALSASAGERVAVLVEADPAGGDVAALVGLPLESGMVSLAASSRHEATRPDPSQHVQHLPGGGVVLVGSTDPVQAASNITTLAGRLIGSLRQDGVDAVIDCGRLGNDSPALPLLAQADTTIVCLQASVPAVEVVRARAPALRDAAGGRLALGVIGPEHYPAMEIAAATGVTVIGALPWDPKGVRALLGASRVRPDRTPLVRSARTLLDHLQRSGAQLVGATS